MAAAAAAPAPEGPAARDAWLDRPDPRVFAPLLAMHLGCLGVLWVEASASAIGVAFLLFVLRAFGLTAGYHRYFAHRSFRTSRGFQLVLAVLGASAAQLGPLWWAGHHRRHHAHTDTPEDVHSPARGLLWAHMGWLMCRRYSATDLAAIPDFARFPELRLLDRAPWLPPALLAASLTAAGGMQLLVWGFFVSTVVLYHVTFAVNSLGHRFGSQPFETGDESRNLPWLAWLSLDDGWHNNHHRFPASARHGLTRAQPDPTWLALRALQSVGLVWGLRDVPDRAVAPAGGRTSRKTATASPAKSVGPSPTRA
jgi:stearoyl-CoA desaturase (delta-9 desaturase)